MILCLCVVERNKEYWRFQSPPMISILNSKQLWIKHKRSCWLTETVYLSLMHWEYYGHEMDSQILSSSYGRRHSRITDTSYGPAVIASATSVAPRPTSAATTDTSGESVLRFCWPTGSEPREKWGAVIIGAYRRHRTLRNFGMLLRWSHSKPSCVWSYRQ